MGNWNLTVNVAGVQPFEPGFTRIPEGAYAVQITNSDLQQKDPSKPATLVFDVKVIEQGEAQGLTGKVYVGTDLEKPANKRHLRGLLMGVGANPAALDAGNINISAEMFVGKNAYIFVEAREGKDEQGRNLLDNRNFVAPAFYEKKKAEAGAKAPATVGVVATTPAPAGIAGLAGQGAPAPAAAFAGGALFGR